MTSQTMEETTEQQYSDMRSQLILLGLFRFSEAIAWTSIFPYAYFMVQNFASAGKQDNVALLASLFVVAFTFCEFLSSSFWSWASDQLGRKITLLIGGGCGVIGAIAFGFSSSIWLAIGSRIFGGLTNPNIGVVQIAVGEMVITKAYQGTYA